jgi:hypothetical protein
MPRKRYKPEEIIAELRQVDVLVLTPRDQKAPSKSGLTPYLAHTKL